MKNTRTVNSNQVEAHANQKSRDQEADVLYQKMGDRWYAFSLINDEVFFGSLEPEDVETLAIKSKKEKISGSS